MSALRTRKNVLAGLAALAALLQATLGVFCPAALHGTAATRYFDPVFGWTTVCTTPSVADRQSNAPSGPHGHHNCCVACIASAPLLVTAAIAILVAIEWRQEIATGLWFATTAPVAPLRHYGGRGSRAPPARA
jgi:hypothetical protein